MTSQKNELITLINNLHQLPTEVILMITSFIGAISVRAPVIMGGCLFNTCCGIPPSRLPRFLTYGYTNSRELPSLRRCNPFMHLSRPNGLTNIEYLLSCLACASTPYGPSTISSKKVIRFIITNRLISHRKLNENKEASKHRPSPTRLKMKR